MKKLTFTAFAFLTWNCELFAQDSEYSQAKDNYYVRSKSYSSNPDSEPPSYVYQLDKTGIEDFKNIDWIDAGLNYRMRYEYRKNDFRRSIDNTDNAFLSRTQAYFGIKDIIDPLRFAIELQDSRIHNSKFLQNTSDVNKLDIFQAYAETYFQDPKIIDRPISIRAGRMAYELIDRKMFARDDWGNTGTNFDGFRIIVGKKENDWQLDSFALQPMIKETEEVDSHNNNQWFYGTVLSWRKWSDIITLQPFYFRLDEQGNLPTEKRGINSPGLRFYGEVQDTGLDYDFTGSYQFGDSEDKKHRAYGVATEIGYSFKNKYKPRLSAVYAYASGDKNPNDNKNERFERMFGLNRSWSNSNTIEWENLETIKTRFEITLSKKLTMEGSYSFYWLASAADEWSRTNLQDSTGASGKDLGQDFDFRTYYKINKYLKTTIGLAHFIPGKFTKSVGRGESSDFIYVEMTANIFGN